MRTTGWLWPLLATACASTPAQPGEDDGSTTGASGTMATTSVGSTSTSVDDTAGTLGTSDSADDSSSGDDDSASSSESGALDEPVDAIIDAMAPNSWVGLPATAMSDVCPEPYNAYACETVMSAWSGATYDHTRDRMIVWGGGHSDSFYNNVFVFELGPMTWARLTELPAGATGDAPTAAMLDSRAETCGYYPSVEALVIDDADLDGAYIDTDVCHRSDIEAQLDLQQPRSSHSYGKPAYLPTVDALFYPGGGYFPGAQATSPWGFRYSFADGTWSETAVRPGFMGRGMAAIDAVGDVWYATDDGGPFARYRPSDDAWDTYGPLNYDVRGVGDIDRTRNRFWVLQDQDQPAPLRGFELGDVASLQAADPFVDIETSGEAPPPGNRVGFVYADDRDVFAAWVGGRDVYMLDPETRAWTHHVGDGDEPTPPATNGTYGRWRYSTKRGVFVLVNDTTGGVFLYKPAA